MGFRAPCLKGFSSQRRLLLRAGGGLATLGLSCGGEVPDGVRTPDIIIPPRPREACGAYDTSKERVLDAYAQAIASETFLGRPDIDTNNRLVFPGNKSYLGMFPNDGDPNLDRLDQHACLTNKPLAMVKSFWAFARGFNYPMYVARGLWEKNALLFLALEPWSWNGREDESFSLERINAGEFDEDFRNFFTAFAEFGHPVIFSLMHEMNGNWYPWAGAPDAFVSAWRRIVDISREVGATNILWAWVINAETVGSPPPREFYPGDDYVDIVGVDGFNFGDAFPTWSSWRGFYEIFRDPYAFLREEYSDKPIIFAEYGCAASPGDQALWVGNGIKEMDPLAVDGGRLPANASFYFNMDKEALFALYSFVARSLARRRLGQMTQTEVMAQIAQMRSNPNSLNPNSPYGLVPTSAFSAGLY
ncbi:glycoside hydrolase family 26 protein [Candidatus Margulisiibacteriota bacterium]